MILALFDPSRVMVRLESAHRQQLTHIKNLSCCMKAPARSSWEKAAFEKTCAWPTEDSPRTNTMRKPEELLLVILATPILSLNPKPLAPYWPYIIPRCHQAAVNSELETRRRPEIDDHRFCTPGPKWRCQRTSLSWILVDEFSLSFHNKETTILSIYIRSLL